MPAASSSSGKGGSCLEEIIVIRTADPDGSVFKAILDVLQEKKAEVIDIAAPSPAVLRLGELEIRPAYRQVLMAGKEIRLIPLPPEERTADTPFQTQKSLDPATADTAGECRNQWFPEFQ